MAESHLHHRLLSAHYARQHRHLMNSLLSKMRSLASQRCSSVSYNSEEGGVLVLVLVVVGQTWDLADSSFLPGLISQIDSHLMRRRNQLQALNDFQMNRVQL